MDSRIVSFDRFSCGFNIMGYLEQLYVAGQAVDLCRRWVY